MNEVEKAIALQELVFYSGASVTGIHFEPGDTTKVRLVFANDTVIVARLADLEIDKLRAK